MGIIAIEMSSAKNNCSSINTSKIVMKSKSERQNNYHCTNISFRLTVQKYFFQNTKSRYVVLLQRWVLNVLKVY